MTTTKQQLISTELLNHKVTYEVSRTLKNSLSPNYISQWLLWAGCEECGWFEYTVSDSVITVLDKDKLLLKHHTQ